MISHSWLFNVEEIKEKVTDCLACYISEFPLVSWVVQITIIVRLKYRDPETSINPSSQDTFWYLYVCMQYEDRLVFLS